MAQLQLAFPLGALNPESVESICFSRGALAVTYGDARDDAVFEPLAGEVRLWPDTRVQALFAADAADPRLLAELAAALGLAVSGIEVQSIGARAWEREWLKDFHALSFGRRLWVCPRHETVAQPDAVVVRLDPGLAFGTGTHASTALCLTWLDQQPLQDCRIIDYGCGSGVLAIAALKLGAARAFAYDIDPQALLATSENAADNGVAERITICARAAQLPPADVLVANILAPTLIALRDALASLLRPDGTLLLAGILAHQQQEVTAAYAKWFDMRSFGQLEDWVALYGRRLASPNGGSVQRSSGDSG